MSHREGNIELSGPKRIKRTVQSYSVKAVSAVLAGAMVLGGAGTAFADNSSTGATVGAAAPQTAVQAGGIFSDVKTGFWAEKHIYKLATQGIVVGNNGLFRPGDSVTQQEAVLMALRFMKLQGNVNTSADVALPNDFLVTNYYKPYVILAFQQGLLDKTTEMAADNLKNSWGERKASREWVAELLIRALGKGASASAAAGKPTGFADDAKVSANKRGYINTAVELGLANGLTGNRFDPQGAVTRAQLATFFSRAEAHNTLDYDNTFKGTISSLKDGKLSLYSNGGALEFTLNANTAYFTSSSENRISLNEIQPYTKVTVIGATYNASYVELTDPALQVEQAEGVFTKLTPGIIWVDSANGYDQYGYDAATAFLDVNGAVIQPSSITAGSKITLLRETFSGSRKVVKVQVTSGIVNKTAKGTVQSVDAAAKSITFKNADGTVESFKWEDGTTLFSSQSTIIQPAELKTGAAVSYTIKDNVIRSVEVTSGVERIVKGFIYELTDSTIVYQKSDGSREVNLLAATPAIVIPNVTSPVMTDLIADKTGGDNVQLTLNSSDQVTKIEVLSRQIEQYTAATVVDYNSKTQYLTFTDNNGKAHVVKLDEKTKMAYGGLITTSLTTMGARLTENRKIDVTSINERAMSVELTTKYTGTLTAINTTSRTVVLKVGNGQLLTMSYPSSIDMFGKSGAAITDVPLNVPVTAVLSNNQDMISILRVTGSTQLEIATVNANTNKMTVKLEGGSTSSELNLLSVPLINEAGQKIALSELRAGDFVNIAFDGSTPVSLQSVKQVAGQVSAVDAAAGTFSVKDYAGASQSFNASAGVRIMRDGVASTALSGISTSDRVWVRKDAGGVMIISVFSQLNRTFARYESATNEVLTKRATLNDNYKFVLAPNVYIHQGDTTLPVQSLKENDNIIMYFNNDKVVEIVKQ
ncbi:S-layer homology domain-containing protein [Paenibacillus tritici]|uniref:S-layer homology domain-containing protein n=1 Tax=Paenibacillus tritici TaxID=1873425 RepID=A0ABX2DMV5_9BACL|nr:S-layer homology domain-containing protein [Paenibacillus tritici]NQX44751.1 S-layer homology domain-containing protein [Paenibacillus tritici]